MNLQDRLESKRESTMTKWDRYSAAMIGAGLVVFPFGEPAISAGALIASGLFAIASALCSTKTGR